MDKVTNTHVYFWGDQTFSNWGNAKFVYKGIPFKNSEQALMWEKAVIFKDFQASTKILENDNPSYVKKIGRQVKGYQDSKWAEVRYDIMCDILYEKFKQNKDLKEILLSTKKKTIVEASPHDKIWGVGLHWNDIKILDENNWDGFNLLGQALEKVRGMLNHENME